MIEKKINKKSNPIAKDLRTSKYNQRKVKNRKIYNRKKIVKNPHQEN
tara:strand:- start:121 stop:261 length:141 start_codon:yes stop_codon:yes gene_type:complete